MMWKCIFWRERKKKSEFNFDKERWVELQELQGTGNLRLNESSNCAKTSANVQENTRVNHWVRDKQARVKAFDKIHIAVLVSGIGPIINQGIYTKHFVAMVVWVVRSFQSKWNYKREMATNWIEASEQKNTSNNIVEKRKESKQHPIDIIYWLPEQNHISNRLFIVDGREYCGGAKRANVLATTKIPKLYWKYWHESNLK